MTWIEGMVVGVVVLIVVAIATPTVVKTRAHRACLEKGWPEVRMAFPLTPYCIKRINQTDTVVALDLLK